MKYSIDFEIRPIHSAPSLGQSIGDRGCVGGQSPVKSPGCHVCLQMRKVPITASCPLHTLQKKYSGHEVLRTYHLLSFSNFHTFWIACRYEWVVFRQFNFDSNVLKSLFELFLDRKIITVRLYLHTQLTDTFGRILNENWDQLLI